MFSFISHLVVVLEYNSAIFFFLLDFFFFGFSIALSDGSRISSSISYWIFLKIERLSKSITIKINNKGLSFISLIEYQLRFLKYTIAYTSSNM